jgi:uncharacterized membrane protein
MKANAPLRLGEVAGPAGESAFIVALGFAMAAYSVLLGVLDLPCITDSCGEVMNSRYGKLFGFPVGLFALPLWLGLLAPSVLIKRGACVLLVAGSVYFVLIQAFVLQSFCVVCAVHAGAAFSLLVFRPAGEAGSEPVFAGALGSLALIGMSVFGEDGTGGDRLAAGAHVPGEFEEGEGVEIAAGLIVGDAQPGIDPVPLFTEARAPGGVVLSSSCPACVRLMERLLAEDLTGKAVSPAIWRTTDHNREATEVLLAASMEEGAVVPERFRRAFATVVLSDRHLFHQGDATGIRGLLEASGFDVSGELTAAEELVAAHWAFAEEHGLSVTPRYFHNGVQHRLHSMDMIIQEVDGGVSPAAGPELAGGEGNRGSDRR